MGRRSEHIPRAVAAGFTLVETVMVAAIIAVLAAIAVPRFSGATARYRADAAAARLVADITLAQQEAINASASRTMTFDYPNRRYTITGTGALNANGSVYTVELAAAPYEATSLTGSVSGDGALPLVFSGFGVPTGSAQFVITVAEQMRTITVDAVTGKTQVN